MNFKQFIGLTGMALASYTVSSFVSSVSANAQTTQEETQTGDQVQAIYRQGVAALDQGDTASAQRHFQIAVSIMPDNPAYRYALSVSYAKAGDARNMWQALRHTLAIDAGHKQAQKDFYRLWTYFDQQALFNVGAPAERIRQVLGEPDQIIPNPHGAVWRYAYMSLSLAGNRVFGTTDWTDLDPNLIPPRAKLDITLDERDWQVSHRAASRYNVMTEYTVAPQTVQNWQELFSTQRLLGMASKPLRSLLASMREQSFQADPNAYWKVLAETDDSILYEWRIAASPDHPAQHEIARIMLGSQDIYRIAYVAKVPQLSKTQRNSWIERLQRAILRPVGS
ncbi:MAG: hypothetical protein KDK04_02455 [Candidatus Competibacteraceae bacterium]|nr:hypothetical protein [Candidatus Competibacteraceae bacterium]